MHTKKALLLAVVAALITPFCFAQSDVVEADGSRWQEVAVLGGVFINGTQHGNITGAYTIGIRKHFGIEFEATSSFPHDGNITTFSSSVNMPFKTESGRFLGFVAGGIGVTRSSADLDDRELALQAQGIDVDTLAWDFTFNIGLGGEVHLTQGLYWRFDFRAYNLILNETHKTDDYQRFTTGLAARF